MLPAVDVNPRLSSRPPALAASPGVARPQGGQARRGLALDRLLVGLVIGGWGLSVALLASGIGDAAGRRAVADLGETVLDVLAAVIVLRAALGIHARRIRLGWSILAIAMAVYAVGDATWAWLDIGGSASTAPSFADAAYVSYYPLVAVALLMFQRVASARRDTLRLTIDSAIVVIGGGLMDHEVTTPEFRERYLRIIRETAVPYLWPQQRDTIKIVPAVLGELSQAIGAALVALYQSRG